MIHSTIPNNPDVKNTIKIAEDIYRILGRGKQNAKTTSEIAILIGIKATGTNKQIRTACKILLEDMHRPVVSCSRGMFIAETKEEIAEYRENIKSRAEGLYRILSALQTIELEKEYKDTSSIFDTPCN